MDMQCSLRFITLIPGVSAAAAAACRKSGRLVDFDFSVYLTEIQNKMKYKKGKNEDEFLEYE